MFIQWHFLELVLFSASDPPYLVVSSLRVEIEPYFPWCPLQCLLQCWAYNKGSPLSFSGNNESTCHAEPLFQQWNAQVRKLRSHSESPNPLLCLMDAQCCQLLGERMAKLKRPCCFTFVFSAIPCTGRCPVNVIFTLIKDTKPIKNEWAQSYKRAAERWKSHQLIRNGKAGQWTPPQGNSVERIEKHVFLHKRRSAMYAF